MNAFVFNRITLAAAACAALFMVRCANISGGGSEAGNARISGMVQSTQGSPVANAMITVRPSDFDPVKSSASPGASVAITGADGRFEVAVRQGYTYSIQAVFASAGTRALIAAVTIGDSDITAPSCTLNAPSSLKVMLPDGADRTLGYVYVPGTSMYAFFKSGEGFTIIDSVPAGIIPAVSYSSKEISASTVLRYNVPALPGDTAVVYNPSWQYSRRLFLNTTENGAQVQGEVYNFPVLVRLSAAHFPFAQAQTDGGDIRFTKNDGTPVPFEIERWDPVSGLAEVWVKADTVRGNDSSQYFTLYWGNPSATGLSSGAAVFDTSNGFIGVWHMNENPSTGAASIKDRTVNAHDATPFGSMTSANSVDGATGKALSFNGKDDYLNAGNVSVPGNYSVGLWVLLDTIGDYERFIYKDSSYTLWYDKDSVSVRMEHMSSTTRWKGLLQDGGTRVPLTTGTWYYLTATFDGTVIRLYKNGTEASVSNPITVMPRTNTKPLVFGKSYTDPNDPMVYGIMDEIRIEGVARSADWIRLCYMNQKVDDKLVNSYK